MIASVLWLMLCSYVFCGYVLACVYGLKRGFVLFQLQLCFFYYYHRSVNARMTVWSSLMR